MKKYLMLLLPLSVQASSPGLNDFAYAYEVNADDNSAVYQFELPYEVYAKMVRDDLGDLRIYNAESSMVPHIIRHRAGSNQVQAEPQQLAFFPLYDSALASNKNSSVHIVTSQTGAIVDIKGQPVDNAEQQAAAWLVDGSKLDKAINGLVFKWPEQTDRFLTRVRVEASQDLNHWTTVVHSASLSSLEYGGHIFEKNELKLPARQYRYLKISWTTQKGLPVADVQAVFPPQLQERDRQWRNVHTAVAETEWKSLEYDTGASLPIDSIDMELAEDNSLVEATVYSRNRATESWQRRYRGIFYRVRQDGDVISSKPIRIAGRHARYWKFEIDPSSAGLGGKAPILKTGWYPHQVVFVARGHGPFYMGYGSASVMSSTAPVDALLNDIQSVVNEKKRVAEAQLGNRMELAGESALVPARPPLAWQKWLLWLVLVLGVTALAMMAYKLYQQMDKTSV